MLRTRALSCAAFGLLGLTAGCDLKTSSSNGTTTVEFKTKEEAAKSMQAALDDLDKKTADLKARAEKATGDEKATLEAKWKASADKRAAAAKKLDDLKAAAADKWQDARREAEHAVEELKTTVNK